MYFRLLQKKINYNASKDYEAKQFSGHMLSCENPSNDATNFTLLKLPKERSIIKLCFLFLLPKSKWNPKNTKRCFRKFFKDYYCSRLKGNISLWPRTVNSKATSKNQEGLEQKQP